MVDFTQKFKSEYDYARAFLADSSQFNADWQDLIQKLYELMSVDGFDAARADSLSQLRKKIIKGQGLFGKIGEDQGILQAVDSWTSNTITDNNKMRSAAIKFLRHIYMLKKSGSCKVWIFSLPTVFTNWPHSYLWSNGVTPAAFKTLLRSEHEHFSAQQKKYLANSTHQALA